MMKNNIVLIFKMLVAIVYLLFVVMGVGEAIIVFIKGDSYYPFGAEATSNTFWYDSARIYIIFNLIISIWRPLQGNSLNKYLVTLCYSNKYAYLWVWKSSNESALPTLLRHIV